MRSPVDVTTMLLTWRTELRMCSLRELFMSKSCVCSFCFSSRCFSRASFCCCFSSWMSQARTSQKQGRRFSVQPSGPTLSFRLHLWTGNYNPTSLLTTENETHLSLLVVTEFILQQKNIAQAKSEQQRQMNWSTTEWLSDFMLQVSHTLYLPGLLHAIQAVSVLLAAVGLQNRQEVLWWGAVLNSQFCKTIGRKWSVRV